MSFAQGLNNENIVFVFTHLMKILTHSWFNVLGLYWRCWVVLSTTSVHLNVFIAVFDSLSIFRQIFILLITPQLPIIVLIKSTSLYNQPLNIIASCYSVFSMILIWCHINIWISATKSEHVKSLSFYSSGLSTPNTFVCFQWYPEIYIIMIINYYLYHNNKIIILSTYLSKIIMQL